jgi:hypothetical protein
MLHEAYSNDVLSQAMTYEWFRCFKNGIISMDDYEQSGRPSPSRSRPLIAQVKNIIHGNQLTVREIAREVGISIGSRHTILIEDLGIHEVSEKFVPRLLTDDQKLQ